MANIIKTVIQFRRAHTEEWNNHLDVMPAEGEPCYDLDLHTLKIGDGKTTYGQLPVVGGEESVTLSADGKSLFLDGSILKLMGFDDAEAGAHAVKGADGNLTWVKPEVTVDEVADAIGTPADAETGAEATGVYAELEAKADATAVEEIATQIGEVPEGTTLIQMITDASYDDTLVKADIVANSDAIEAIDGRVTIIEGKAHEHENKTVLDGITAEKVKKWDDAEQNAVDRVLGYLAEEEVNASYDTLKEIADWIESDTTNSATLITRVSNLEAVGAEKNVIASVDDTQFAIDENRNLTLLEIAMGKVTGLQDALEAKADKATTLAGYGITDAYTKEETLDKIAEKITEVNGGESAGEVLSQLNSYKETNDTRVDTIEGQLAAIEAGAQVNKIEQVYVGETLLDIVDKVVTIPVGAGLKSSEEIVVGEDGTMSIGAISWDKISQGESELVLDGGGAA